MKNRNYESILVSAADGVATITLNVPARKNPLSPLMVNELLWALDDAKDNVDIRVIVLTGAGDAFSAGGDLKQMGTGELPVKGDFADLLLRFTTLHKPTVARVPGYAYGGGLGLVASCDFAVAGRSAKLGTPEIRRGLFPMMIMAVLQRTVPRRDLLRIMLLGETMLADEAMRIGLVTQVVDDERLDSTVVDLAAKLATQAPTATRMGLAAFHRQADQSLEQALPQLRDDLLTLLQTDDAREGLAAFAEKREPKWKVN